MAAGEADERVGLFLGEDAGADGAVAWAHAAAGLRRRTILRHLVVGLSGGRVVCG